MKPMVATLCCLAMLIPLAAQARIAEVERNMVTYPFGDPDPVAVPGRIYPYFRFDGYAASGTPQRWKLVQLENEWISLWVNPATGGKIWGAVEKAGGREFIYFNPEVKFRDVAMRGAWTSGGLEVNFGVIGHAPTCSSPVDWTTRTNPDGSVSCFIGALDLPSRTEWRVEIRLPANSASFSTRSAWFNTSPLEQAYYHWMNVGIKTRGDLQYVFPGSHHLGHDGRAAPWPVDGRGRRLDFYEQNNFGGYKSYHVFGSPSGFFGGYWREDDSGFGHDARYDGKPGKKIWIWGHSRQGMIWEGLLSDTGGQYTELQSGRLFNQTAPESSATPFKHRSFTPHDAGRWTEHWFPVRGTGGLTGASASLAVNLQPRENLLRFAVCPLEPLDGRLRLLAGDAQIWDQTVKLDPLQPFRTEIPFTGDPAGLSVWLDGRLLYDARPASSRLARPVETPAGYDFSSVHALFLQAKELERQRSFPAAKAAYGRCLDRDPFFSPALAGLAGVYLREARAGDALPLLQKALAVDTYDPAANYLYGLAQAAHGRPADARDGFALAAQSQEFRTAAYTELARLSLREGRSAQAVEEAELALAAGRGNRTARHLLAATWRLQANRPSAERLLMEMLSEDPLDHGARFELYLLDRDTWPATRFTSLIRNELPHENYLELAAWYLSLGRDEDARQVLELAPAHPQVQIWQAWLLHRRDLEEEASRLLRQAAAEPAWLVFPFRTEEVEILHWAVSRNQAWSLKYYLALVLQNLDRTAEALDLLQRCGNEPDFWPFYASRARLRPAGESAAARTDLERARQLAPDEWRTALALSRHLADAGDWPGAREAVREFQRQHPENYYTGLQLARTLLETAGYQAAAELLEKLAVLPCEGAKEGRVLWREACLRLALEHLQAGRFDQALARVELAREWPENLGAGKPYDVDERLEDYLAARICQRQGEAGRAATWLERVAAAPGPEISAGVNHLLTALVRRETGREAEAGKLLDEWLAREPDDPLARWCRARFRQDAAAEAAAARELDSRLAGPVAAWPERCREYRLLRDILHVVR